MFKYEFFGPALRDLKPAHRAQILKALDAAILYGAIEYAEGRMPDKATCQRRYNNQISTLNAGETFGSMVKG